MILPDFISKDYPVVTLSERGSDLITGTLINYQELFFPVVDENHHFLGLLSKNLLRKHPDKIISFFKDQLLFVFVRITDPVVSCMNLFFDRKLDILPLCDSNQCLIGVLSLASFDKMLIYQFCGNEKGAWIEFEIKRSEYALSEISRIVENVNGTILQLYTMMAPDKSALIVSLKVNLIDASPIVESFQRFDYRLLYYSGEAEYINQLKRNYENLMAYLKV